MNTFTKTLLVLALASSVTGCITQMSAPQAISGSKADGTVKIAATYNASGKADYPELFNEDNRQTAIQRCGAWGYTNAEAFGGFDSRCVRTMYDLLVGRVCVLTQVIITYQCTGGAT
jgi:hypothetical protein